MIEGDSHESHVPTLPVIGHWLGNEKVGDKGGERMDSKRGTGQLGSRGETWQTNNRIDNDHESKKVAYPFKGEKPLVVVLMGYPGSGKQIHAENIARRLSLPHISMGGILKRVSAMDSRIADIAARHRQVGALLPDELVIDVLAEALSEDHNPNGFVLQGFPRTLRQAEALNELTGTYDIGLILNLVIPRPVLVHRLLARRSCQECGMPYGVVGETIIPARCNYCGGKISPIEGYTVKSLHDRLAHYDHLFKPVITRLASIHPFVSVDGVGLPESISARLTRAVAAHLGHPSISESSTTVNRNTSLEQAGA